MLKEVERCQVGVTGHRILTDLDQVQSGIANAFRRIALVYPNRCLTLFSSLAPGADQMAADAVLQQLGGRLVAVLPFATDDYAQEFTTNTRTEFQRLLARSDTVLTLPPTPTYAEAYESAGLLILESCDVLLAVWDGQEAQAQGGTGAIVNAARAQSKPIIIVRAGNRMPGTDQPTTLGNAQGEVLTERLRETL